MERYARRDVLAALGIAGVGSLLPRSVRAEGPSAREGTRPGFRQEQERVRSVVGASHSNLERVRELVLEQPALAKASWDWGFGDWESALGAASHTGRREIAEFLIAHGARPNLFSAAMLGELDVVRAHVEARPDAVSLPGPHGISLVRHARAGGDEAALVLEYLLERVGEDEVPLGLEASPTLHDRYGGRYVDPTEPEVGLTVAGDSRWLMIGAGEVASSRILPVADDVFHPTGAPAVRLRFDIVDGRAASVTITDGSDGWTLERR